ncbi:hypothetical protein CKY47_25530 [Saccharothrix yanglingensis]|uniref:Uncharacterized protein n=1 Tax=Saccharothrix yanglingensis TaxID=659496 RepID=A0ABU0X5A6_9PSEU|nr:hypothetical protein [Saccharothrix yanglingensis]
MLTFAEIGFLLRARPPSLASLAGELRLPEADPATAAAGLASLAARGLCEPVDGELVPAASVQAVHAALCGADRVTRMLGWEGGRPVLAHLVTGPHLDVGLFPVGLGRFSVSPLDRATPLGDQAARFLDRHLAGARGSAVLVRTTTARRTASLAVAVDEHGAWFLSDSLTGDARTDPSSRDLAVARLAELVGR